MWRQLCFTCAGSLPTALRWGDQLEEVLESLSSVNEAPGWVFLQQVLHYMQRGLMAHTAPYGLQGAVCSHDAAPHLFWLNHQERPGHSEKK